MAGYCNDQTPFGILDFFRLRLLTSHNCCAIMHIGIFWRSSQASPCPTVDPLHCCLQFARQVKEAQMLSVRRFFATRRPWMLLIVPALLTTAFAAIAGDPAPAQPETARPPALVNGVVLLNGAVVTPARSRGIATLVPVVAGRQLAHLRSLQATPAAPVGGPGPSTQLHLIKVVRNGIGGTALETDWILEAAGERKDGPTNLSGTSPVDSDIDFKPDRYTLSEAYAGPDPSVGQNYTASPWSCVFTETSELVAVSPDSKVVVNFGDDVTCTIINSYGAATPTPSPTVTPSPTSTPTGGLCTKFKITGRKLYRAFEGPYQGALVGLAGWTVTATLVGAQEVTLTTTTDALGEFELSMDYPGPMAFVGATIRVCEQPRAHWVSLTGSCATVIIPDPLPPTCTLPVPDFVNAQEYRPTVDP
jgi:hypothetical protein